jgi:hypothetical protein
MHEEWLDPQIIKIVGTKPYDVTFRAADFAAGAATSSLFFLLCGSSSFSLFPLTSRILLAGMPAPAAGATVAEALTADCSTI